MSDQSASPGILTSSNLFSSIDAELASVAESVVVVEPDACAPGTPTTAVTAALAREIVREEVCDPLRDAIWATLVRRAVTQPRLWQRIAIWTALPGLRVIVNRLHRIWRTDLEDLRSEVVLGFLEALRRADPDQSHLGSRLWWNTYRLARQMCQRATSECVAENMDLLAGQFAMADRAVPQAVAPVDPGSIRPGRHDRLTVESERLGSLAARLGLRAVLNKGPSDVGRVIFLSEDRVMPPSSVSNTRGNGSGEAA
nr:hypothetical protein [Kibdelosporangium sp. MJ126-NF4]CTQ94918.1 hypothetical protein [Kibdelosporangium sp. MJ126-NF4]